MKIIFSLFISIFTLIALPSYAYASTFYVSPNGSDNNPGTEAQPFKTVQKGINTSQNGDVVFIKTGTYDLQKLNTNIYKNISLIGEDKNSTILTNGYRMTFHTGFTAKNLKFTDFDKTYYDNAVFRPVANVGENIDGVYIDNVIAENVPNFIWGKGNGGNISNVNITNSTFNNINSSWSANGILLNTTGNITNINIKNNVFNGIITSTDTRDVFGIIIGSDENYSNPSIPKPSNINIENNFLSNFVGGTVYSNYYAAARVILIYGTDILINNNVINNVNPSTAHNGIYIKATNSSITNNVIHNGGSAGDTPNVGSGDLTIKGEGSSGNIISGNKVTSDYPEAGIGIFTKGGVEISNNHVNKTNGYFAVYSYDALGRTYTLLDNFIETKGLSGNSVKISGADGGEVAYNVIISYESTPLALGSSVSLNVHDNNTCRGYNCGSPIPTHPKCQNQGYSCCSSCKTNPHPEYNSSCSESLVCCDSCGLDQNPTPPPTQNPTSTPVPTPKQGDANQDGQINEVDYNIWLTNYNQSRQGPSYGDFNNDGVVNGVDYVIWLNNFGL